MTMLEVDAPDDVADAIAKLDRRLRDLESVVGDPTQPLGALPVHFPDTGITIGDIAVSENVEEPTDLDVDVVSFLSDNQANFSWTAAGATASEYEIEVVRWDGAAWVEPRYVRTAGTAVQVGGLRANSHYGARIYTLNSLGRRSDPFPAAGYVEFDTLTDESIPALLTGLTMGRGATSIVMKVDPSADVDVANGRGLYQFQVDTVNTFSSGNLRSKKDSSFITAFSDVLVEAPWYGRVRAIDEFGNEGPWTAVVGPVTAGGVNDSMVIADLSAAKITVGTMSGDRITTNTLSAATIKTSSLTAADITLAGGSLQAGSPPTTGLLINSQGLRLYAAGVATVILDAAAGTATFKGNITGGTITIGSRFSVDASGNMNATNASFSGDITSSTITGTTITGGTIRTASSGARLVIDQSVLDRMRFYNSGGTLVGQIGIVSGVMTIGGGNTSPGTVQLQNAAGTAVANLNCGEISASGITVDQGGVHTLTFGTAIDPNGKGWFPSIDVGGGDFTVSSAGSVSAQSLIVNLASSTGEPAVIKHGTSDVFHYDSASTRKIKKNIRKLDLGGLVEQLNPVWFQYDPDAKSVRWADTMDFSDQIGFIAEEVAEVHPKLALYVDDEPNSINWKAINTIAIMAIQELRKDVDKLLKGKA